MSKRTATDAQPNDVSNRKRHQCLVVGKKEKEEEDMLVKVLDLTFASGFFVLKDLQALMNTSKVIADPLRTMNGWKDHFVNDKVEIQTFGGRTFKYRKNPLGLAPPFGFQNS